MERLLMLHLQAGACSAEVLLNGMPVAHVGTEGGHACLPVHEYTLTGKNRLELIVGGAAPGQPSPSQPRVAMVPTWARARLVLARQGRSAADPDVRVLVSVAGVVSLVVLATAAGVARAGVSAAKADPISAADDQYGQQQVLTPPAAILWGTTSPSLALVQWAS